MLSLLRRTRRKVLDSSQFRRYVLYALGEILLVMIGILLALQVNNWNTKKKNKDDEKLLLIEVNDGLLTDSIAIVNGKDVLDRSSNFYEMLYRIHAGELPSDSLRNCEVMRRVSLGGAVIDMNYPNLANEVLNRNVKLKVLEYYQAVGRWREYIAEYNRFIRERMRPFLGEMNLQNYGAQYRKGSMLILEDKLIEALKEKKVQQMLFEASQRTDGSWPYSSVMHAHKELKEAIGDVIK